MILRNNLLLRIASRKNLRNFSLTSEQIKIQVLCRDFAENELKPKASELDRTGKFPYESIKKLGALGLMGIGADKNYGGSNADALTLSLIIEELARGCGSTATILSIHNSLYVNLLQKQGTESQKIEFLKPYTSGKVGVFALSEPNAGSDVGALSTTAIKDGNTWILNGSKSWVTSGIESDCGIIFATINSKLKHKGITGFIVPFNLPGLSRGKKEKKMGMRGTSTCDIYLENVRVPENNLLGDIGGGFKMSMDQLNQARVGVASLAIGMSQAAIDLAIDYSKHRIVFGKPILDMKTIKHRLAEMNVRLEGARLLTRNAAMKYDSNDNSTKWSSIAKIAASECVVSITNDCIKILGGMGYVEDYPAERLYRDAKITEIIGGVTDVHKLIVANKIIQEFG